jgi:hypothetical protein
MGRRLSEAERTTIWDMRESGVPVKRIARHLGRQNSSLRRFIADAGGTRPTPRERSELRLSLGEREEISRGLAAGWPIRAIAVEAARFGALLPPFALFTPWLPNATLAGARLMTVLRSGHDSPLDRMAAWTLSRDSRTAASGSPTMVNPGRPLETWTSTETGLPIAPVKVAEAMTACRTGVNGRELSRVTLAVHGVSMCGSIELRTLPRDSRHREWRMEDVVTMP